MIKINADYKTLHLKYENPWGKILYNNCINKTPDSNTTLYNKQEHKYVPRTSNIVDTTTFIIDSSQ